MCAKTQLSLNGFMIYELEDTSKAKELFAGWEETLIHSALQKVMGKVFVTDPETPKSAFAFTGVFAFYAGEPDEELVRKINELLADVGSEDEIAEKLAAFSTELGLSFTAEEYKEEHQ